MVMRPYDDPAWLQEQGIPLDQQGPLGKRPTWNSVMQEAGLQTDPEWKAEKERRKPPTSGAEPPNPFIMAKEQEKQPPSLIVREAPEKVTPPAEQKNPANPEAIGVEAPNPLESPAGAIAATQHNLQNGVGRQGIITPPQQPDYAAILKQMETVESKRVVFDANKAPDWQNSQALTFGLLSFGLNLMAGNDMATAFNQAGSTFNELYGREKRQAWANDLRSQGYDEHEIQAYVESGDHKALTDPAEKQARAVERRKAQLGLLRAEYEASPEYVQYQQQVEAQKAAREAGKYEMDVANHEATAHDRAERLRMAQEKHLKDMTETDTGFTSRDYSQIASAVMPTIKVNNQRITFSSNASKDLNDIDRYMQQGDIAGASASFKSFMGNQARAEKGGGATLTGKDAEAAVQIQHAIEQGKNLASLRVMGKPTQFWLESMRRSVADDLKNQVQTNREVAQDTYSSIAVEFGHEQAQKVVSRLFAGAGVGALRFDPDTGQLIEKDLSKEKAKIKIY